MKIRPMVLTDLDQVITVHIKTLPCTVSSKVGFDYLQNIYQKVLTARAVHLCLVAVEDKKIVGAITATKDLKATQKILSPVDSSIILAVAVALVKRKITPKELLDRMFFEFKLLRKFKLPYVTILTLFVNPDQQKKGIGKSLVRVLNQRLKKAHINEIFVDTLITNIVSMAFYQKVGFKKRLALQDSFVFSLKI